ncbi:hypothetical protein A8938_2893 [Algoriphagus zhangzhouensis]|uniref:Uncharacterized protein n=1 Tax=Algoriphagus zhangzhouensis TaxID=1073327 RepID=A0A1M7ZGQ7_9BACT|nr:hypothetical protein A8938_2893 [Algoriphagus zhangzhouensis]SHO64022.1 hypothetical protein SAMN04488108_3192 [Algoriphagus zhangzhouensis]
MTHKSHSLESSIGKPVEINLKSAKSIGSTGYFLKSFKTTNHQNSEVLKLNSKCNFQKHIEGLLLLSNQSNEVKFIPISFNKITEILLIRGTERIAPFFLSPMWILLKLRVSKLYARYFRLKIHEYSISQMQLIIKTTDYEMNFIANGYLFENQVKFFEDLGLGCKLRIEVKTD